MNDRNDGRNYDDDRLPTHDIDAERWCLGGCMREPAALNEVAELLEPDDFFRPAHSTIYMAMIVLFSQGIPVDPITLKAQLEEQGDIGKVGGPMYLAGVYGDAVAVVAPAVLRYSEIIRELAARRKVGEVGARLVQRVHDRATDIADLVTGAQEDIGKAVLAASAIRTRGGDVLDVDAFCSLSSERMGAVIPGLLDHQDRMLICGFEGDGKTTLGYQVAVATAAGIHPFAWSPIPAQRVLIMDFENPQRLMQIKLRQMTAIAERSPRWNPRNLKLLPMPGGVDVTRAADVMRLVDMIRMAEPDLIVGGPIYKMFHDRGQGAEELHSQVTGFWDIVRARYGPALWLETHPPGPANGQVRIPKPAGSTIYLRWPEFGFGLARGKSKGVLKVARFRGDREEGRPWPESFTRNHVMGGWPWVPTYPANVFSEPMPGGEDEGDSFGQAAS
jgi:DnaB-like helicase N terminal domain/AAA domain